MDELYLMARDTRDFSRSSVLCFTETRLCGSTPDSDLQLPGFTLSRADRDVELSRKTRGGGICLYINNNWCDNVRVVLQSCSPDLETLFICCKPLYSVLKQFSSFILVGVFTPPQADVQEAQRQLADQILCVERGNPDSLVIVLGNFNKCNLTQELPKYKQFINCPTREGDILDHCYTTVNSGYLAVSRTPLGQSDHSLIHLIPRRIRDSPDQEITEVEL